MWRAYTGVIHCAFDKIPNLQNCCTAPDKTKEGEGASDTCRQVSLSWSICKKSRHLGFGDFIDIWSMADLDSSDDPADQTVHGR